MDLSTALEDLLHMQEVGSITLGKLCLQLEISRMEDTDIFQSKDARTVAASYRPICSASGFHAPVFANETSCNRFQALSQLLSRGSY